ncbi:uncharacterized protein [Drosophila tropicalis]|uniref:uncharacterized protein n=1 Tax=Drosophila tropicalis TaxID=46794 RepID=UPI0035ABF7F9
MLFGPVLICQVEKLLCLPISCAVFAFLFMACTLEVVLLRLTISDDLFRPQLDEDGQPIGIGMAGNVDDDADGEDNIYYENVTNNYEYWARRRRRYHQRQQQQQQ